MRFLVAIVDALAAFVRRNPLFVLCIFVLALVAPALLKGIAAFILYLFLGLFVLVALFALMFRLRLSRLRRDMEEQARGFGPGRGDPFAQSHRRREGDIQVHKTASAPEKRVSNQVGDYVEFEETADPKNDR